ncbi:MAG TPA: phage tail tape measure protein [Methylocystis sp.]|jgi:TP901 family phage tail tape measure protein
MSMSVEMILRLVDRATGPLRGVEGELNRLKGAADRVNAAQAAGGKVRASDWMAARKGAAEATKEANDYRLALAGVAAQAVGAAATAGAGFAGYGLKQAVSFEKAMADVKKKVDLDPGAEWRDVENLINRTSREIGISREHVAGLAATAGQAGIEYKDLGGFMMLAAKAASAWDMSAEDAADRLAQIKAQTQWTIPQLKDFADQVNAAGDSSAAKERDIVEMFQRSGAAAKAAGVPLETSLAALTALKSTGMEESTAARFWNAFASKLATAGMGGRGAKQAAEGFEALGLSLDRVASGMKADATKTVLDILDRLEKSPDKAQIGVQLFGQQWWDEATRAGQALPEIRKQLEMLHSGKWKGSLDKNLAIDLDTTANHLERTKAMVSEIGDELMRWALPPINKQLEELLDAYHRFKDGPDKPIIYSPTDAEAKARLDRARAARGQGEARENYERRLSLDGVKREAPAALIPTYGFVQTAISRGKRGTSYSGGVAEAPKTIPSGPALPTFAGLNGQNAAPHVDLSQIQGAETAAQRAGQTIMQALGVTAQPKVDTSGLQGAGSEAQAIGQQILAGLNVTARPQVDTSQLAQALSLARELSGALSGLGAKAAATGAAVRRGVAAGSHALHDGPEAH